MNQSKETRDISVNHNLLAMGMKGKARWVFQMAKAAATELTKSYNVRRMAQRIQSEFTNAKIVNDVYKERVLYGFISVLNHGTEKVEIGAQTFGGAGSFLLTPNGAFLHGNEEWPVTELCQIEKCEKLKTIVSRHNPTLGNKLVVAQPS